MLSRTKVKILKLLERIVPHDLLEKRHIMDTVSWIKSGKQIFRINKPDHPDKHLVSYFVVFDEANEKILLVDHKKALLWLPSGGHVEVEEDPAETVVRECMEELYIAADFWHEEPFFVTQTVTVGKTAGHTDVSLWYVIKGNSEIEYQYDQEEFIDIKWFHLDNMPYDRTDLHMKRFVKKLVDYQSRNRAIP